MKEMGYNAATIGNHEFDAGLYNLKKNILSTNFQFIISNYDFVNTKLEGMTTQYKIYILEKQNPLFDSNKNITKDGIHIMIPNVVTKKNFQLFLKLLC